MAKVKSFLYSVLDQAIKPYTKKYETEDFRAHALSYGWPQEVVSSMSIDHTATVTFSHPKHKKIAMDLNYGTQDEPPSPAITTYIMGVM